MDLWRIPEKNAGNAQLFAVVLLFSPLGARPFGAAGALSCGVTAGISGRRLRLVLKKGPWRRQISSKVVEGKTILCLREGFKKFSTSGILMKDSSFFFLSFQM